MPQFFLFSSLDLNVNFVFWLRNEPVVAFEVDVNLLLESVSHCSKSSLNSIYVSGRYLLLLKVDARRHSWLLGRT